MPERNPVELERDSEKKTYSLFNPVPTDKLRKFHPDRPGSTNSPYTVDAGHIQPEFELFNFTVLNSGETSTRQLSYPNPNFRIGLNDSWEAEIAWLPFFSQTVSQDGDAHTISGLGDINFRLKKNMLGNDGGELSWALMPGVKIPTGNTSLGNSQWEPYLMIPFSVTLTDQWSISLMPEIDFRKNSSDNRRHVEFNSPFTFGHHLYKILDGYAEFVSHSSSEENSIWANYAGFGMTARTGENDQLDIGINFGLSAMSPQYNPFAGWVVRY